MRPCRQFETYHWQNSKLEQRTYFQFLLLLLHSRLLFLLPEVEREGVEALFLLLLLHSLLLFLLPEVAREGVEALSRLQFHLQHVEDEAEVEDEGGEPLLTALACATQGHKILVSSGWEPRERPAGRQTLRELLEKPLEKNGNHISLRGPRRVLARPLWGASWSSGPGAGLCQDYDDDYDDNE